MMLFAYILDYFDVLNGRWCADVVYKVLSWSYVLCYIMWSMLCGSVLNFMIFVVVHSMYKGDCWYDNCSIPCNSHPCTNITLRNNNMQYIYYIGHVLYARWCADVVDPILSWSCVVCYIMWSMLCGSMMSFMILVPQHTTTCWSAPALT
jgi:hypothetical protein